MGPAALLDSQVRSVVRDPCRKPIAHRIFDCRTLSGVDDGFNDPQGRSFIRAEDHNAKNFSQLTASTTVPLLNPPPPPCVLVLNGYKGVWTFDQ